MDNTEMNKSELNGVDLYKAQERYGKFLAKKRLTYKIMFLVCAVASFVTMFAIPLYKYHSLGKKRGQIRVVGDYTSEYIIEKYFNGDLGPTAMLNTLLIVSLVVIILASLYTAIGGCLNMFAPKLIAENKKIAKFFGYGMLEVVSTILFVGLMVSMMFAKIDMTGNVDNGDGFWLVFIASIVMICTSIPLSDKKAD